MDQSQAQATSTFALGHPSSHLRLWLTAIGIIALDLWSKHWAFSALEPTRSKTIIPGFLEFRRSLNDGAVFGAFTGYVSLFIVASIGALLFVFYLFANSPRTHRGLHIALGLILAGAIGNLYDRVFMQADIVTYKTSDGEEASLIGKIAGGDESTPSVRLEHWPEGGLARTFVRKEVEIHRQGVVRDFIKFTARFPKWVPKLAGVDMWPWVFNVADAALVCGVITLLLHSWTDRRSQLKHSTQTAENEPSAALPEISHAPLP